MRANTKQPFSSVEVLGGAAAGRWLDWTEVPQFRDTNIQYLKDQH